MTSYWFLQRILFSRICIGIVTLSFLVCSLHVMAFRKNALSYANWSKLVLVSTDSTSWYAKECYTLKSYELQLRKKQCHYKCNFWLGFFNLFSRKPNCRLYIFFLAKLQFILHLFFFSFLLIKWNQFERFCSTCFRNRLFISRV